jgi:hypothetical protein
MKTTLTSEYNFNESINIPKKEKINIRQFVIKNILFSGKPREE